jgi:hypothetical protein
LKFDLSKNEMSNIRSPLEKMAGCYYLARLIDKIRLDLAGQLSEDYRPYLFHRHGADTQFMNYFALAREELIEAVKASNHDDAIIAEWFAQRISLDEDKQTKWNELAVNLGKQGYPMAKTLIWAKENLLPQCKDPNIDTVFKAIEWDEGRLPRVST